MGQPTLEAQLKNARAELKRLQDPRTLVDVQARVTDLEQRLEKKQGREKQAAARERLKGPDEDQLREAKVTGVLLTLAKYLTKPSGRNHAMRSLLAVGLSKLEAEQRIDSEVARTATAE